MEWTEIVIEVNTCAVEAVANMVHEAGAGGVVLEHGTSGTSFLTVYFPAGQPARVFLQQLDNFWHQLSQLGLAVEKFSVQTRDIAEQDWEHQWKQYYHPLRIGKVLITPSWIAPPRDTDLTVVELDPGLAFGTGTHPTTQMCIEELANSITPGCSVLDLGCGSGILSIVAAKLGAATVVAVDVDAKALDIARANAARNQCQINTMAQDAQVAFARQYDITVVNISTAMTSKLLAAFNRGEKTGTVIFSGFTVEHLPALRQQAGDNFVRSRTCQDWACLVVSRT